MGSNLFLDKNNKGKALAQRIAQHEMEAFNFEMNITTYQAFAAAHPEEAESWNAKITEEEAKIARVQIAIDVAHKQLVALGFEMPVK